MKLDILYKRTKTGAIQYWKILVAHKEGYGSQIVKESGQLGTTNPIRHIEDVNAGKNLGRANETSPEEQAESQAQSDWTKKHDEGYKSLNDLDTNPQLSPGSMDFNRWLESNLPLYNTDASGNVKPMLAKTVDWKKVTYPCLVQPKLDGVRCLMVVKAGPPVVFLSRKGKEYTTLDHIKADVEAFLCSDKDTGYNTPEGFILDGEIYSDELTFQEIVAAVKKQRPDSLKLHFRAYDIVNDNKQRARIYDTESLVTAINSPFITMIATAGVQTKERIMELHNTWVGEGYEGVMIRLMDGHYAQGQRSSHLLKVKEFQEDEFTFIRFEQGQREEDLLAVCCVKDGRCFKAKVIGNREEKKKLQAIPEKQLEYKKYTVKFFQWTDDGLPRFPIGKAFRDY